MDMTIIGTPNAVMMASGRDAPVAHLGQPAHSFVLVLGEARGVIQRHGQATTLRGFPARRSFRIQLDPIPWVEA